MDKKWFQSLDTHTLNFEFSDSVRLEMTSDTFVWHELDAHRVSDARAVVSPRFDKSIDVPYCIIARCCEIENVII